jgi:ribose 5-phosphate isomerase RpiB
MKEDQALYRDQPKQDGSFKAVAFMSDHRFFIQDEKLHYEYNGKNFHVDTEVMQRTESSDHYPHFTSVQK